MSDFLSVTVRVADFPQVKAVIEAADAVCDAEGDSPWALAQKVEALRETLAVLSGDAPDDSEPWRAS